MDGYNSLPPLSEEIRNLLTKRSTADSSENTVDFSELPAVCNDYVDHNITEMPELRNSQEESVFGETSRELKECEMSLDDKVIKETTMAIELNRRMFSGQLQEIDRHRLERLEKFEETIHRWHMHEKERRRFEDMSMLVE